MLRTSTSVGKKMESFKPPKSLIFKIHHVFAGDFLLVPEISFHCLSAGLDQVFQKWYGPLAVGEDSGICCTGSKEPQRRNTKKSQHTSKKPTETNKDGIFKDHSIRFMSKHLVQINLCWHVNMVTWWYLAASDRRPAWFHDFDPVLDTFSSQTAVDFAVDIVAQGQTHLGIAEDEQMISYDFYISSLSMLYLSLSQDPSQIDNMPCWTCRFKFFLDP